MCARVKRGPSLRQRLGAIALVLVQARALAPSLPLWFFFLPATPARALKELRQSPVIPDINFAVALRFQELASAAE